MKWKYLEDKVFIELFSKKIKLIEEQSSKDELVFVVQESFKVTFNKL